MKDFVIDSMAWYKHIQLHQDIRLRFYVISSYLQDKGLTNKKLVDNLNDINDDFSFKASDLTQEGLLFMKNCYSNWVGGIDKGKSPEDTRILDRCLKKMRG